MSSDFLARSTPLRAGLRRKEEFICALYATTSQLSIPLRQAQGHLTLKRSSRALTLVSWTEAREE